MNLILFVSLVFFIASYALSRWTCLWHRVHRLFYPLLLWTNPFLPTKMEHIFMVLPLHLWSPLKLAIYINGWQWMCFTILDIGLFFFIWYKPLFIKIREPNGHENDFWIQFGYGRNTKYNNKSCIHLINMTLIIEQECIIYSRKGQLYVK